MPILPATLLGLGGLVVILLLVAMGFSSNSLLTAALPALALVGLALFTHLQLTMALCVATYFSTLTLPGLPFSLDLSKGFALVVVTRVFLDYIILRRGTPFPLLGGGWAFAYIAIILVTLGVRGFGLRILGSENWGGGHALAQLIMLAAFIASNRIRLERPFLRWALRGIVVLSACPMLADLVYYLSNGRIYQQFILLQYTSGGIAMPLISETQGIGVWRLQRAMIFAPMFTLWATQAFLVRRIRPLVFGIAILFSLALAGVSGHRVGLITIVCSLGAIFVFRAPKRMAQRAVILGLLLLLATGVAYVLAPWLPKPFQRAISFLPGLDIDTIVKLDAAGTVNSRLQIWDRALADWQDYAWVGRGFALSSRELADQQFFESYSRLRGLPVETVESAFISHDYHSGPITLLIDLGVAGLFIGILLLLRLTLDPIRDLRRRTWNHADLEAWYLVFAGYLATNVFTFFAVYGSHYSILTILQIGTLLHLVRNADVERATTPTTQEKVRVPHLFL